VLAVLCTPKSSPSTAPLFFGIYTVADGERRQEDALFCLKEEEENILKGLRVRSKTLGKMGPWLNKKKERAKRGATLSGFPFEELQGLLTWPRKQMAHFLSFFLCRRVGYNKEI
jgi:hypothetical protein